MGSDVSRLLCWQPRIKETLNLDHSFSKGITNATMVSKVSVAMQATNNLGSHCWDNVILGPIAAMSCNNNRFTVFGNLLTLAPISVVATICSNSDLGHGGCLVPGGGGDGMRSTDRHGRSHKMFFAYSSAGRTRRIRSYYATEGLMASHYQ